MSRVFEGVMQWLSEQSGYGYNELVDIYNEIMEDSGEVDFDDFVVITMEHDW